VQSQRGFTILELMIVVAIITILATVVLPHWFRDSRKAKAKSEVSAMFTELSTKEEQYLIDNDGYLATLTCPSTPATSGQDASACNTGSGPWVALRVQLPTPSLYCAYTITTGPASTPPAPPSPFTMTLTSVHSWFYIVANCDMDGDSTHDSTYFTSNLDQSIQVDHEGT
jgi:prepilin-type N-terminal cleavage/methylation domain-containing protein